MDRSALTPRQQEVAAYELLGLDVVISDDLSECTALEVNSAPRQASTELSLQVGMYEISLGLERTPVEEGQRWLELHPSGAVIVPEAGAPSEPEPEPEPHRGSGEDEAGRFVQGDGWAAAAAAERRQGRQSTLAGRAAAAEPEPEVYAFLDAFPGLV